MVEVVCWNPIVGLLYITWFFAVDKGPVGKVGISLKLPNPFDETKFSDLFCWISLSLLFILWVLRLNGGLPILESTDELFNSSSIMV